MNINDKLVIVVLVMLIFLGFVLRNFPFSNGNFDEFKPPVITSYDLFANIDYASWIYESEDARFYNPSRILGIENSFVQQPIFFHLFIASFGKIAGLHPFQSTTLVTNLVSVLIIMIFFLVIRRFFNNYVALMAASFSLIPFAHFWFFQMNIGYMYDYYSFLFVPAILFIILVSINNSYSTKEALLLGVVLGSFVSSQWLSHFVELFAFIPLFCVLFMYCIYVRRFSFNIKLFSGFFVLTFIPFFIYFFSLTRKAHLGGGLSSGIKNSISFGQILSWPDYFPKIQLPLIYWIFLVVGSVVLLHSLFKKNTSFQKKIVICFIIYVILFGYSYLLGVTPNRTIRQLFNAYMLLFFIVSVGVYYSIMNMGRAFKKENINIIFIVVAILPLVFNFSNVYSALSNLDDSSFINDDKWEALMWVKENTAKNGFVFYLNGYFHEVEMLADRPYYEGLHLPTLDYGKKNIFSLCNKNYPDRYYGWWGAAEYHPELGGYIKSRKGLFDFEMIMPLENVDSALNYSFKKDGRAPDYVPLKFFDYVVVQYKNSGSDNCIMFFVNESLNKGHSVIWQNDEVMVLKINKTL